MPNALISEFWNVMTEYLHLKTDHVSLNGTIGGLCPEGNATAKLVGPVGSVIPSGCVIKREDSFIRYLIR